MAQKQKIKENQKQKPISSEEKGDCRLFEGKLKLASLWEMAQQRVYSSKMLCICSERDN